MFEGVSGLGETDTGPELGPNLGEFGIRPKLIPDLSESETGLEPVPDLDEVGIEPSSVFKDSLDVPFDNLYWVANINKNEGSNTPVVIIQTKPVQIPQTGEGQRRKQFKTPADRTDLPLVRKFRSL